MMSLFEICQWLQNTEFGTSLRESIWMFPIVESTHVLGLSLSVGTLFWCQAIKAYNSIFFKIKIALLFLAAVNAIAYHTTIYRKMDEWDKASPPPLQARFAGWASIALWIGIIIAGRNMAYNF